MKYLHFTDTHQNHQNIKLPKEKVDIVFHTGDFNDVNLDWKYDEKRQIELNYQQTLNFLDWFANINAEIKILIAGNHELIPLEFLKEETKKRNIIFLHNETFIFEKEGELYKIFGHGGYMNIGMGNYGYYLDDTPWNNIPDDVNILLTHTPCENIGDSKMFHGCPELKERIRKLYNLRLHLFGHIHEGAGVFKHNDITFINGCKNEVIIRELFNF